MSSKRSSSFSRSSSPASIIGGNEDLLIEIFIFLPPKSLIRFKAVSKHWHSLISSPFFCRRHALRRRPEAQQSSFILGGDEPKLFLLNPITRRLSPFPLPVEFRYVKVLQSCNGLLLLRCRKTINGRNHYFVANPTTSQQRSLSPLTCTSFTGLYLIFDPSLSPHYKAVCFINTAKSIRFHIYNSDTREWKLGGETTNRILSFRSGIYFNGGICFLRSRSTSSYRFVADDNVTELPDLPRHHGSLGRQKNYSMESNGVLLCLTLSWKEESNELFVSEMKNFEEGWRKKFRVEMRPFLRWFERNRAHIGAVVLLGMIRGECEGDSSLLLRLNRDNIVLYKFGDGVFETVDEYKSQEYRRDNRWWDVKYAHSFIRSLAPV